MVLHARCRNRYYDEYYDDYYVWYYERTPYYLFYAYYASVIEMYYDCIYGITENSRNRT